MTDITSIWTQEGWLYLAVLLDLFSRRVVGWATSANIDRHLALAALDAALRERRPSKGLVHHSNRGSTYASGDYRRALDAHAIKCSMSRKGDCWDNAVAESFFASLKREVEEIETFESRAQASAVIAEYIEQFGNSVAVDKAGTVLVTGDFSGTTDFGGGTLTSAGSNDIYVATFDASGAHLWSKRFVARPMEHGCRISVAMLNALSQREPEPSEHILERGHRDHVEQPAIIEPLAL